MHTASPGVLQGLQVPLGLRCVLQLPIQIKVALAVMLQLLAVLVTIGCCILVGRHGMLATTAFNSVIMQPGVSAKR